MTRVRALTAAAAACMIALLSCRATMVSRVADGRAHLTWDAIAVPADATDVRYEVAIFEAASGLPIERVRRIDRIAATECEAGFLPAGDYVWSVRARYRRLDREWVTRWRTVHGEPTAAIVPERGFCRLQIR